MPVPSGDQLAGPAIGCCNITGELQQASPTFLQLLLLSPDAVQLVNLRGTWGPHESSFCFSLARPLVRRTRTRNAVSKRERKVFYLAC